MKRMRRAVCAALCAAVLLGMLVHAAKPKTWLADVLGHWAQAEIEAAAADHWVDGYPDETFRPNGEVTRAEFVKLLLAAVHLQPGSPTAEYLHEAGSYPKTGAPLTDMDGHWLTRDGWTQAALDFGLIVPADYAGNAFVPNRPITRCEAAVMIVRALGLVGPAQVIDGTVYLPVRDVLAANNALYDPNSTGQRIFWDPITQQLCVQMSEGDYFTAGSAEYSLRDGLAASAGWVFPAPARLLYGELMAPVYAPDVEFQSGLWQNVQWDKSAKTVVMPLERPYYPMS